VKAHLVYSYHLLAAQEHALRVTTLTSLIEYTACSLVSAALGILVYIEGSKKWTTIVSFVLFALALVYKAFDYVAYVRESWFQISEADYKRLMGEAKAEHATTEYQG
jgi:membrane protein YdbS with pleckstrin-like domain